VPDPSLARPRVAFTTVAKRGGNRVLSHLEPSLAAEYTSAVAGVALAVEAALDPAVLANRVADVCEVPPRLELRPWRHEHARLRRAVRRLAGGGVIVRADVQDCYRSIAPSVVTHALSGCGASRTSSARCARVLGALAADGVSGLPIGPPPSAVLANAVLVAGDAALRSTGVRLVRWVDDWWIAAMSTSHAVDALVALSGALAAAGLRLNRAKTGLCAAADVGEGASVAGYHRAAHADPLPRVVDPDAVVPGDGVVAARRRTSRRARGGR
jgi:hypothetical protein